MRQHLLAVSISSILIAGCHNNKDSSVQSAAPAGTKATVALLETTDLHTNILSYDYYKLAEDKTIGFERTAGLIAKARQDFPNNVLLDDGDTIQGTVLGDYQALINPLPCDQKLAMYKAMDLVKYDGGNIGNHEFNYGLKYLNQVTGSKLDVDSPETDKVDNSKNCQGPNFPLVLANIYSNKTKAPLFKPYTIITKNITATTPDGKTITAPLKVGIIGFTPPQILNWDKRWLDGRLYTEGVKETAEKYIPEMKANGAELIVVLSHGGLDSSTYSPTMENGSYHLTLVKDVDALLVGHSHQLFPSPAGAYPSGNMPGVDKVKGFVNGVPTVMGSFWGQALGVIKLGLNYDGHKWVVDKDQTTVENRTIVTKTPDPADPSKTINHYTDPDPAIAAAVKAEHEATVAYVKTPIGSTDYEMNSYFALVGDPGAIEVVNQAQANYASNYIKANLPQYANLPVLSVQAPFKTGFGGPADFTDVQQGQLAINNAADLYLYPNTIHVVKVTGKDIKNWLERAATVFNQIDPNKTTDQYLISTFPGYNFDMFTSPDISYEIDVTQPLNSRIRNLTYKGLAVSDTQEFVVATNNYRASGGGSFPGLDGSKTIYASPDANRDVLIGYIKNTIKDITRAKNGSDHSWHFSKVQTAGRVTFSAAAGKVALAQAAGLNNITQVAADDGLKKGNALYAIDLSK